jgi:hypothetical protein
MCAPASAAAQSFSFKVFDAAVKPVKTILFKLFDCSNGDQELWVVDESGNKLPSVYDPSTGWHRYAKVLTIKASGTVERAVYLRKDLGLQTVDTYSECGKIKVA